MSLPNLPEDQLAIFVFGPGTGELIAVRAPGEKWLVVDGCGPASRPDALKLLEHYNARPSLVVLTHPHRDHAMGLAKAIEVWCLDGDQANWPILGMVPPPDPGLATTINDAQGTLRGGVTQRALAAIYDRWERSPSCQWEVRVGDQRQLGSTQLTVLAPEDAAVTAALEAYARKPDSIDWNSLSTVIRLEWHGHRFVLGSDLVSAWPAVAQRDPAVNHHVALKIPHHGSRNALHRALLNQAGNVRSWVVTPFASEKLPRFDEDPQEGGIAFLQTIEKEVILTSLPRARSAQGGLAGATVPRSKLHAGASTWIQDPPAPPFPACYVALLVSTSGSVQPHFGPASVRVVV